MKLLKVLATTAVAVVLSSSAYAEKLQLKFGHVGAPGSLFAESAEEFARVANEKLGDKAEVLSLIHI